MELHIVLLLIHVLATWEWKGPCRFNLNCLDEICHVGCIRCKSAMLPVHLSPWLGVWYLEMTHSVCYKVQFSWDRLQREEIDASDIMWYWIFFWNESFLLHNHGYTNLILYLPKENLSKEILHLKDIWIDHLPLADDTSITHLLWWRLRYDMATRSFWKL